MSKSLKELNRTSGLSGVNASAIEAMYEEYLTDEKSVSSEWQKYFSAYPREERDALHASVKENLRNKARPRSNKPKKTNFSNEIGADKQAAVSRLIQVYTLRGHQIADIDPLDMMERRAPGVFKLDYLGLTEEDLNDEFSTSGFAGTDKPRMKLSELLALLKKLYCEKIGVEFAHMSRAKERIWLRTRYEREAASFDFSDPEKISILEQLTAAEGIERYLHTRFVGQKRFSLEGGESLIPMLSDVIQRSGEGEVREVVIGMAHRGRLSVLVNVLGQSPELLYDKFEEKIDPKMTGTGDVKYHLGFSGDIKTDGGNVHVSLAFNPSHLEIVNPVVEGSVRARQDRRGDSELEQVLPILIHGDAAFAGQGVVTETFQMSQVNGFRTGGTLHIVINNQIGFTTSKPSYARSTPYCSDIAKMIEAPVFHVNGDDPEAVIFVTRLAMDYRRKFKKDVVIDLVCYRRQGHNEADEPSATQPLMYAKIKQHKSPRQIYADQLVESNIITADKPAIMQDDYRDLLDQGKPVPKLSLGMVGDDFTANWSRFKEKDLTKKIKTKISKKTREKLATALVKVPEEMILHGRVQKIMELRSQMAIDKTPMDWGFAESMAYASLIDEGYNCRVTGQDSSRGTFFHRHAVLYNQRNKDKYVPLHSFKAPGKFRVIDSYLSEEAVLGFEYGYAITHPNTLVVWEAQFGDFANGAQVIIDQFISSGETKWGRLCGLTLLLPHGFEGQGPEHSSARLERFLQLCAENNMQVCVPSTPAQMFHMLRRQMVGGYRKPLIVMSPKSMLRNKASVSNIEELTNGHFKQIIEDQQNLSDKKVKRLVLCSGKIYYDLDQMRAQEKLDTVAIVRLEQLYPFPIDEYAAVIKKYPNLKEVVWCQEEPQNQGAWYQIRHRLQRSIDKQELIYSGRRSAAAPATGLSKLHLEQQKNLVINALGL
jgi:2-oxoglutarate dehydrogenase E1 component|tara:strand:+ start:3482 stop:6289 length:2808 start_codon:yes stop_codon:yes gene_type:complete